MGKAHSSYYPPRSRWWSPLVYRSQSLRHFLQPAGLELPAGVSGFGILWNTLVPGLAFRTLGHKQIGSLLIILYLELWAVYFVALGHWLSEFAFGLLIAIHVVSIGFLWNRWVQRLWLRAGLVLVALLALSQWLYFPISHAVTRVIMPLRIEGQRIFIDRRLPASTLKPGSWLAHQWEGEADGGVLLRGGFGLDRVLAMPGDRLQFFTKRMEINGIPFRRQPHMPVQGEWVVPEKSWFVWPRLAINTRNNQVKLDELWMHAAMVTEANYLGQPCRSWFGRKQRVP